MTGIALERAKGFFYFFFCRTRCKLIFIWNNSTRFEKNIKHNHKKKYRFFFWFAKALFSDENENDLLECWHGRKKNTGPLPAPCRWLLRTIQRLDNEATISEKNTHELPSQQRKCFAAAAVVVACFWFGPLQDKRFSIKVSMSLSLSFCLPFSFNKT